MKLKQRENQGIVTLDVEGNLRGGPESEKFHAAFKSLIAEGKKKFIVNLKKVEWANSQGVGMLIGAYTTVKNAGGEFVLVHVVDRIRSILVVTQLLRIFTTFETEDEAVKHLSGR